MAPSRVIIRRVIVGGLLLVAAAAGLALASDPSAPAYHDAYKAATYTSPR